VVSLTTVVILKFAGAVAASHFRPSVSPGREDWEQLLCRRRGASAVFSNYACGSRQPSGLAQKLLFVGELKITDIGPFLLTT